MAAVEAAFDSAMDIDLEPKYGFIRFILERVIFQTGMEEGQSNIIRKAMTEAWRLRPIFDSIAKALVRSTLKTDEIESFARSFLKRLRQEKLFVPGQTLAWVCWLVGEMKLKGLAPEIKRIAETSDDGCVVREALIALRHIGSRNDVLSLKDRRTALPNSLVVALVMSTAALGRDEREHWKKHPPMVDFYEKLVFRATG